jgi:hypothetical protein
MGGIGGGSDARFASARPSGDRATLNAASSAVAKLPRRTSLALLVATVSHPRLVGLGPNTSLPPSHAYLCVAGAELSEFRSASPSACACCSACSVVIDVHRPPCIGHRA